MTCLKLTNVSYQLPQQSQYILKKINLEMNAGDFIILLGSNGSGKSTLLKLLNRDLTPTEGEISLLGKSIQHYRPFEFSQLMTVLTQQANHALFGELTLFENYTLIARHASQQHTKASLKTYLEPFHKQLPNKLDDVVDPFSGGEKQALLLALYLLNPPRVLLLDEHTSALDPKTSSELMAMTAAHIKQHHITCILTTHQLDIALQYGNRIIVLENGELKHLVESDEKALLTKDQLFHYYG